MTSGGGWALSCWKTAARWHDLLQAMLEQIPGLNDSGFTAHALLAATRADLIEYLAGHEHMPRERMRAQLASFTARVLGG